MSGLAKAAAMIKTGKVGEVSFGWTRGVLNRLFRGLDGQYKRVVVPRRFRHGPTNVSHESLMAGHLGSKKITIVSGRSFTGRAFALTFDGFVPRAISANE